MNNSRSPNAKDRALSQRVRARRLEIGMTQMELAGKVGTTFQQAQKYEVGANRISVGRLERIAVALGVPSIVLLSDPPVGRRSKLNPAAPNFTAAPDALRLVKAYDRMKPNPKAFR